MTQQLCMINVIDKVHYYLVINKYIVKLYFYLLLFYKKSISYIYPTLPTYKISTPKSRYKHMYVLLVIICGEKEAVI